MNIWPVQIAPEKTLRSAPLRSFNAHHDDDDQCRSSSVARRPARGVDHYHHVHNDSESQSLPFIALPPPSFFQTAASSARLTISAERQIKLLNDERKASPLRGRHGLRLSAGDKVAAY